MAYDFFDIQSLQEDYDIELKHASGKEGKGSVPKSFWETYSAMANTSGGYVFFGIKEKSKGAIEKVTGIEDVNTFLKEFWDGINNKQKISENILTNECVDVIEISGKNIVRVYIPQATRTQRPVFINSNPFAGTYRRNYEGDYHCSTEIVRQMLGEQTSDTKDAVLLPDFNLSDIDLDSLNSYRQIFLTRQPTHPFNDCKDIEFLRNLGGWTMDRKTKKEGLTLAGLLMFGKLRSILDALPNYIVDYQERPRAITESRWVDRITTDFTWPGNLFSFYRKVINKLYQDLKVPFVLKGDERIDDTPVHEALREALVNAIIHADYNGTCSVLIVKRPDLFGFRNPGLLRVPRQDAIKGGISDCRNRNMQKMFQMIGRGDQAGSGFPKIFRGWSSQHWRSPILEERMETNQVLLRLPMSSLLPEEIVSQLKDEIGESFDALTRGELIALVTARTEKCVTHGRLKELTKEHSADLTRILHGLVEKQLLVSEGVGKATFYYLPGEHPIADEFGAGVASSVHKSISSVHKGAGSVHNGESSVHNDSVFDNNVELDSLLSDILASVSGKKRVGQQVMLDTIVKLCKVKDLTAKELAELLGRSQETIRSHYLNKLCNQGKLHRKYPNIINHPDQKYLA